MPSDFGVYVAREPQPPAEIVAIGGRSYGIDRAAPLLDGAQLEELREGFVQTNFARSVLDADLPEIEAVVRATIRSERREAFAKSEKTYLRLWHVPLETACVRTQLDDVPHD